MDISTAYKQHQQIINLQADIAEVVKEIKITEWAYRLAFVATFVVYFVFVWMMYVSDLWGFTSWLVDNLSEIAALVIYTVLAITLPLSMAMIKEIGYKHFAKYRNNWAVVVLIVGILAFAGVVYESISSSSQQQHISTSAAEKSKTFDVITNTQPNTIQAGSMALLIAEAQKKYNQCEERLKDGREPHCKGDKGKLQGLLDAEARAMDSAERASVAAIETKTKALQELKEDAYKPAFKAIRDSFGVTISTGVMLVTTFISVIFEISHLLLILFLSQKLRRKDWLTQSIINLEAAYLNATGKAFKTEDFTDDSVLNMQDVREQSPNQMGFGQPAMAQFKYQHAQQEPQQPVGFIRTDHLSKPATPPPAPAKTAPAQKPVSAKLGTHDDQIEMPGLTAPTISTYNRELSGHGIDSPADKALNKADNKATIQRIINKGLQAGKPEPETLSQPSADGSKTGSGDAQQSTISKPSAEGSETLTGTPDQQTLSTPSADGQKTGLYDQWVQAVTVKECKPSVRPTWEWIQKRISNKETGSRTHDRTRISTMQKAFFSRAIHDGLMMANPKYRNGGKKFIWKGANA